MSEHLGYVVWRKNRAKWEVLNSFGPGEKERAEVHAQDLTEWERAYDGHEDLHYTFGVSSVNR